LLDVSDKISALIKKLLLWKEDVGNMSGSLQFFTFLSNLFEICLWCCLQLSEVYFCKLYL